MRDERRVEQATQSHSTLPSLKPCTPFCPAVLSSLTRQGVDGKAHLLFVLWTGVLGFLSQVPLVPFLLTEILFVSDISTRQARLRSDQIWMHFGC